MNDREKQRLYDAKLEIATGLLKPMKRREVALRGGDPEFNAFVERMEQKQREGEGDE